MPVPTPLMNNARVRQIAVYLVAALLLLCVTGALGAEVPAGSAQSDQPRQIWIQNRINGESQLESIPAPDTSLWNPARIGHYQNSLVQDSRPPMGVLVIDRIGLEVPVYNGADELELNLGTGRIPGTGLFYGSSGNLAISGHRDGYFRALKDLEIGDRITLRGVNGDEVFTVNEFNVVHKTDHAALKTTEGRMLTLVTCYPFYFVGHAPDRYLIQAVPASPVLVSGE